MFATVIVALVFLPLFMLGGVEGRLLRPLGFAYVVASRGIAGSAHGHAGPVFISLPRSKTVVAGGEPALTQRLKTATSGFSAGSALLAACAGRRRGPSRRGDYRLRDRPGVLVRVQRRALTISSVTIPVPSLTDSNALGNALERLLLSVSKWRPQPGSTGRAELDEHVQGVESAETDVRLQMRDRPRTPS